MIYEWPKITKNLIITTNKHTEIVIFYINN